MSLTKFEQGFLECALWSSYDDDVNPLDDRFNILDFSEECLKSLLQDCKNFQEENLLLLAAAGDDAQNGHDFWLTRNGHGAGFWDRGYRHIGEELTKACKVYGSVYLYVGDDLKVHC